MTPTQEPEKVQGESGISILLKVTLLVAVPAAVFAVIRVLIEP